MYNGWIDTTYITLYISGHKKKMHLFICLFIIIHIKILIKSSYILYCDFLVKWGYYFTFLKSRRPSHVFKMWVEKRLF